MARMIMEGLTREVNDRLVKCLDFEWATLFDGATISIMCVGATDGRCNLDVTITSTGGDVLYRMPNQPRSIAPGETINIEGLQISIKQPALVVD